MRSRTETNDLDGVCQELLAQIAEVASGRMQTRAESNEQREIAIWKMA